VAKATSKSEPNAFNRLGDSVMNFVRDTRAELRKVTWPSREEAWRLTLIVLGAVVAMSLILGAADFLFAEIMRGIVSNSAIWIGLGVVVVAGGAVAIYFIERE
jgi:preprotein translocase subunit SecE